MVLRRQRYRLIVYRVWRQINVKSCATSKGRFLTRYNIFIIFRTPWIEVKVFVTKCRIAIYLIWLHYSSFSFVVEHGIIIPSERQTIYWWTKSFMILLIIYSIGLTIIAWPELRLLLCLLALLFLVKPCWHIEEIHLCSRNIIFTLITSKLSKKPIEKCSTLHLRPRTYYLA